MKVTNYHRFEAGDRLIAISHIIEILVERHMGFNADMNNRMIVWFLEDTFNTMAIELGKPISNPDQHAAVDRSCWMFELVNELLLEEPAIDSDPTAKKLANRATDALWKLYQHLGAKHL